MTMGVQIWGWVAHVLTENHREHEQSHDVLVETMKDKGLIVAPNYKNPGYFKLTPYGHEIATQGGWIKFLYDSMSEGEKIHRLLKFVVDSGSQEFEWTLELLSPAFKDKLDKREIRHLCQRLINESDAVSLATKDYFAIGITEASTSAYYSKKYLHSNPSPVQRNTYHIEQFQAIDRSTINGPILQTPNSNIVLKEVSNTYSKQEEKTWTWPKFLFAIITGVIIVAISIYWKQILEWFRISD